MPEPTPWQPLGKKKKIILLVTLFTLLALWLTLTTYNMTDEEQRYNQRMLGIKNVDVTALPPSTTDVDSDASSAISDSVTPALRALATCLVTTDSTHAPATLTLDIQQDATLSGARFTAEPLEPADIECLERALKDVQWPRPSAAMQATVQLVPLSTLD